ncbi:MAG: NotI family restriction endonuclease [Hyphomicrobiales bacterium]|nr:NotI family restriction endonuclease [Hyphomicrobiales bacterium]
MLIAEVFGFGVDDHSTEAWETRNSKLCPFRGTKCTKSSKTNPIGICSLSDGKEAAATCPVRFVENDKIFKDAARLAFGEGVAFGIYPEVRILKIEAKEAGERDRKIGKVDFLLGNIDDGKVIDFAAVEVQAVYFSGGTIRPAMNHYLAHRKLDVAISDRRPDFRSSAQKRLVPQLQLKIPVFRRWGKKFFVAVDTQFFRALPGFRQTTHANSEITWLTYPIEKQGHGYRFGTVQVVYSEWDEVRNSLREGNPPEPDEIVEELQTKLDGPARKKPKIISI